MNANPFFSIIIPVHNVAPYLRECLDSVAVQAFVSTERRIALIEVWLMILEWYISASKKSLLRQTASYFGIGAKSQGWDSTEKKELSGFI